MSADPERAEGTRPPSELGLAPAIVALSVLAITIFAIRLAGPPVLVDNEYRVGASVLNVIQGGNWILPHDSLGNTDKPPMLTWLSALPSLATGRVNRFTLYLPTALATLALALLIFSAGRRYFGWRAGFLGGLTYLLSNVVAQQIATARWDGLFAFTVALVALAAFHAWTSQGSWTIFWLAAAISTLTKGPLGVVLGAFGLLAVPWERLSGHPQPMRGRQLPGIILFVGIVGGWFLAAYAQVGTHLIDNMIRSELVRHAVMGAPGHRFRKPLSDFLANFAPWSLLTVLGLGRVWSAPAPDDGARRFERFCFSWFVAGLLLFCLSPHNPARLLYPIIPPAAILAGREMARITAAVSPRTIQLASALAIVLALCGFVVKYHYLDRQGQHVRRTAALLSLYSTVHEGVGDDFPLTYVRDVPFALQLAFNTMRPTVTFRQAAALLHGEVPAYVAVRDAPRLRRTMGRNAPPLYDVATSFVGSTSYVVIVSNRRTLEWSDPLGIGLGPLRLQLDGTRIGPTQDGHIVLYPESESAGAIVKNAGRTAITAALDLSDHGSSTHEERRLAAGETWRVGFE